MCSQGDAPPYDDRCGTCLHPDDHIDARVGCEACNAALRIGGLSLAGPCAGRDPVRDVVIAEAQRMPAADAWPGWALDQA